METETRWLTRHAVAERACVTVRTVDRWLTAGILTRHRSGPRRVRIDAGELDALLSPEGKS